MLSWLRPLLLLWLFVCGYGLAEPQHPVYHVTPPNNWMNDPNGPMYFNGVYHLFFQYNPFGAAWGNMHWGHVASKDLVHWQHLPFALAPDMPYDQGGVFSGSATIFNGVPVLVYTSIGATPTQSIAFPVSLLDPLLTNWTKSRMNPVIKASPPDLPLDGYRDPTTAWQVGDYHYMLVGAGIAGKQGMALLYRTEDFTNWTYLHPLYASTNISVSGDMWECPDFYPLGNNYVLKASTNHGDMWFLGDYALFNQSFAPSVQGLYDYGAFYASKTFHDTLTNRRILWGWVGEMDSQDSANARGWAGIQSLPRELTVTADNRVAANPIVELQSLRTSQLMFGTITVNNSANYPLKGIQGDQFELLLRVQSVDSSVTRFGLIVRQSPKGEEATVIYFLPAMGPTPVDMPGDDYRGVPIPTPDPTICQTLCDSDFLCRAWTYVPANWRGPLPECFLKGFPAATNPNPGCVSGRRPILAIDRALSTLSKDADKGISTAPLNSVPQSLHVFVDHSIIEVFGNDGTSNIITRVYPTLASSVGVSLFVEGPGHVTFSVDAWNLGSGWVN